MALDPNIPLQAGQIESPLLALGRGIQAGQQMAANRQAMELQAKQSQQLDVDRLRQGMLAGYKALAELPESQRSQAAPIIAKRLQHNFGIEIPPDAIANESFDDATVNSRIAELGGKPRGPDELKVGRYREIKLPDGSTATLDTATNAVTTIQQAAPVDLSVVPEDIREDVKGLPVENQRKIAQKYAEPEARGELIEREKQDKKALEITNKVKSLVDELLANESGIKAVTGFWDEMTPTILQGSRDTEAALKELGNLLTVENLGLMSGVLSESDIAIIRAVGAAGLSGGQDRIIKNLKQMQLGLSGEASKPPPGIDQQDWIEMTSEERAAFGR